ncbi:MAG: T9SS type A sorting domain-containing protein [Candidatus Cloacimonetes bacterium]|nr:T9SS type A sorting domain-containing protein [Candidatus Cloacimonadota bacterium]
MRRTKTLLTFIILIGIIYSVFAETIIENKIDGIYVDVSFLREDSQNSEIFAIPAESVEVQIVSTEVEKYSKKGDFVGTIERTDLPFLKPVKSFVMRDLYAHKVTIQKEISQDDFRYELKNISYKLIPNGNINIPEQISSVFKPIYKDLVSNYETSYLRDLPTTPAKMAIITNQQLVQHLDDFLAWKHAKGIYTDVYTLDQTGTQSGQIKDFLQNLYDNPQTRPDYVLLIGDVDDTYQVSSFYFSEENNVTDNPFVLFAGDDYFPDAIIGRISVDYTNELAVIINKILKYEKEPYMNNTDWYNNAVLVAGNYSSTPPTPVTPTRVTRWLADKMQNYGFDNITQVYYPPTYPGTAEIASAINNGASFVTYRGWGDANGWHYPYFHNENINDLNNGFLLPVMTSIVCNTGDFANNVDPCFGETWLRSGTVSLPKGGVVFIGPSDLHTSTKFNNAIFSGFYQGLLDEDIFTFGSAVLRGKIELYENYPLNLESGGLVEFYFYTYNILGDPSIEMWTKVPEYFNCDLPDDISLATNHLDINLPEDLNGAMCSVLQNGEIIGTTTFENGNSILYLNNPEQGEIVVTITKPNFHPYIKTISVNTQAVDIGILEANAVDLFVSGESNEIAITLKNYGSETASNVYAELTSENPYISIIDSSIDYGDINAGQTAEQQYSISLSSDCPDESVLEFELEISTGSTQKFYLVTTGLSIRIQSAVVNDANGILEPGEENAEIEVSIKNNGDVNAVNLSVEVVSGCSAVTLSNNTPNLGNLNAGQTVNFIFNADVIEDCYVGRMARFELKFTDENGLETQSFFVFTIGDVDNTAPTGPDDYGYYCYDSNDINYEEKPDYFWLEIDPNYGGNGEVFLMGDDTTEDVSLPFSFKYYGEDFNEISICSNGWISFETTWMVNFRNWGIPSALGPYGMVCAYWDDLKGEFLGGEDFADMRICYYDDSANHRFIVEWNEAYNKFDVDMVEKFQLVLFDPNHYQTDDGNGVIQFNYHTINNPDATNNYTTIGIENMTQSDGIEYTFAGIYPASASEIGNEFALKFTTDNPDNHTFSDDSIISNKSIVLHGNYPNPFNPVTTISFELTIDNTENTEISIYNMKGQRIKKLEIRDLKLGINKVIWDGTDGNNNQVSSGIFFYKLKSGKFTATRKMILMK